jgi:glycosyltransferase involved in cell wall biosynthesis
MKIVALMLWTKNGRETLQAVLKRINKLTPDEVVNRCLILDDHSTDDTRKIEESFGWQVGLNEGTRAHAEKNWRVDV